MPPRTVPTAAHLELVRRINEQAGEPVPGLADLVLATPAPGRGRVDVPLPWPAAPGPAFGIPPIDPAQLPEEELVRLAVGVLARFLPRVPAPDPTPRAGPLAGAVAPAIPAARQPRARSRRSARGSSPRDSWRPTGDPSTSSWVGRCEVMMAEHWAAATARGAHPAGPPCGVEPRQPTPCPPGSTSWRRPTGLPRRRGAGANRCTWWSRATPTRWPPRSLVCSAPRSFDPGTTRTPRTSTSCAASTGRPRSPPAAARCDASPRPWLPSSTRPPPGRPVPRPSAAALGVGARTAAERGGGASSRPGWLRCRRRSGGPGAARAPRPTSRPDRAPSTRVTPSRCAVEACARAWRRAGGEREPVPRPPARRRPQDRHLVRAGHLVHPPRRSSANAASSTPPTATMPTSWPRST